MAIKPILFNTEMVRAILDGRKSQTRRIMKPQPKWSDCGMRWFAKGCWWREGWNPMDSLTPKEIPIKPGDILWVRETWCRYGKLDEFDHLVDDTEQYYYRADGENPTPFNSFLVQRAGWDEYAEMPIWHPSIHMPKEAAIIFLRVTGVRVERVQDITPEQASREGVGSLFLEDIAYGERDYGYQADEEYGLAKEQFAFLWDSTIKKADPPRYGWNANPWVWVIEFERCEKPEGWRK